VNAYRQLVRPLLFRLDPERAHDLAIAACRGLGGNSLARAAVARAFGPPSDPRLRTTVAGMAFPSPVGLGAGWDKSGSAVDILTRLGFGSVEVGSVSRLPSAGNAIRPRAFRLPDDEALIINYGVPNDGSDIVARRLAAAHPAVPLGVNLVETNTGAVRGEAEVIAELAEAATAFPGIADFLVISAECANAPGAHPFARLENLRRLLDALAPIAGLPPVFVKIRVPADAIDDIVRVTDAYPFVRGFRVNTIAARPYEGLATPRSQWEAMPGSISSPAIGFPAMLRAVRDWYVRCDPARYALLASGGIRSGSDAYTAIRSGASLVQFVTALVYEGPALAGRINRELAALLAADGFTAANQAVGIDGKEAA
jgi:dihydroorotate dehydrogenase (fumarate)/dihydroorotate dehydrogenase